MKKKFQRILLSLFFAEIGLFLIVFPWVEVWEQNYFTHLSLALRAILLNYFFRGAISGLGILNLWLSLSEIFTLGRPLSEIKK
ncbi:MAG: hypothetical protein PHX83_00820 [Acidobacteriia bacterium]|nr:hypothetical protein [Terriglobia bacterium]